MRGRLARFPNRLLRSAALAVHRASKFTLFRSRLHDLSRMDIVQGTYTRLDVFVLRIATNDPVRRFEKVFQLARPSSPSSPSRFDSQARSVGSGPYFSERRTHLSAPSSRIPRPARAAPPRTRSAPSSPKANGVGPVETGPSSSLAPSRSIGCCRIVLPLPPFQTIPFANVHPPEKERFRHSPRFPFEKRRNKG